MSLKSKSDQKFKTATYETEVFPWRSLLIQKKGIGIEAFIALEAITLSSGIF